MNKTSTSLLRSKFTIAFSWVFLCLLSFSATSVSAQVGSAACNTFTPLTDPTFSSLSVTSSQGGIFGNTDEFSNKGNLIDNDAAFNTAATYGFIIGGSAWIEVKDLNATGANVYPAGSFAGFVVNNGITALGSITITTYLGNTQVDNQVISSSLLTVFGGKTKVGIYSSGSFDRVRLTFSGAVIGSISVYAPVVQRFCAGPALACNTPTTVNTPTYPVFVNPANTGLSGLNVASIDNQDNAVSPSTTDFASINLLLSAGSASFAIKDQLTDYPVGTFAGFDIASPSLLNISALGGLTVSTYLNGAPTGQSVTGGSLISAGSSLLGGSGRRTIGFITTTAFDEIKLTVSGVNALGVTNIYGAIFERFCDGPSFACSDPTLPNNTITPLINPTFPVYVDGANTQIDAVACAACSINNSENVIDNNTTNFATVVLTVGLATNASFAVANALQTYPVNSFAGFDIEQNTLVSAGVLSTATITLLNNGTPVQTSTGNALVIGATTDLLTGRSRQIVGVVGTVPYDEVKITFSQLVGANLGTINIYNAVFEKTCSATIACNTAYNLSNPTFPVVIDAARTGVSGVVAAATTVRDPWNVVSTSTTDFARITNTASVATVASIAVLNPIDTYPTGTFAGFTVRKVSGLLSVDLFSRLTVNTYNNGTLVESRSAGSLIDLSIGLFGASTDFFNVGFVTTQPFDEIQLSVAPLVGLGVLGGNLDVFGAFIDTRTSSGGGLVCALNTNPDFAVTNKNVTFSGSVKTNDIVPAGTTYGPAPGPLSQPAGSSPTLTVNTDGTYTFVSATPGVYTYAVPVCASGQTTGCATQTLAITVLDPTINTNNPVANPDIISTAGAATSPAAVTVNIRANDGPGNPGGTLGTPTIVSGPTNGVASIVGGNLVYTPTAGFYGTDIVTYQVCETPGTNLCATTTVTITVRAPGSANTTIAADDYSSTYQGSTVSGNVKTNDSDPEGNTQTVTAQNTTIPGRGTLALAADGSYTFTPIAGATGPVDFTYTTCDNGTPQACANGTLHILINPFNPHPDFVVTNTTAPATGSVSTNDQVPAGTTYSQPGSPASQPAGSSPTLTLTSTGSYTFTSSTPGVYVYNVPVCPPGQTTSCPTQPLTITVLNPAATTNNPVANPDFVSTTGSPTSPTAVTVNIRANDGPGNPGGTLGTPTIPNQPANGTASIDGSGNLVYTPTAGFYGTDVVTYQVCETPGTNLCATTTVTITVRAPGSPATATVNDDYVSTTAGVPASGNVLSNDSGNGLTVSNAGTTTTASGTLVITSTGSYTFTPATGVTGPVALTYTACDNSSPNVCASATLHVLVIQAFPDLTPSQFFSSLQVNDGQTIDMLVSIRNVAATPTSGEVKFFVTNYVPSSGLSVALNTDPSVTIGGNTFTLNTGDFTVTSNNFAFTFTSVTGPSGVIADGGRKFVAFKITRATGATRGSVTSTVTIQDRTGGGETPVNNNVISNTILKP